MNTIESHFPDARPGMSGAASTAGPAAGSPSAFRARPAANPLGLAEPGVHELVERAYGGRASLARLALAALPAMRPGAVLWVTERAIRAEHGRIFGPGVAAAGGMPGRLLLAEARRAVDALAAVEDGLTSGALAAVIGEVTAASFTASRRLALAAGRDGVPAILLMPHSREGASAALQRWRIAPRPSGENPFDPDASGAARWQAMLERSRLAPDAQGEALELEMDDETHSLRVVSGMAPRQARPSPSKGAERLAALLRGAA